VNDRQYSTICPACDTKWHTAIDQSTPGRPLICYCKCDDSPVRVEGKKESLYRTWLDSRYKKVAERQAKEAKSARVFRMQDGPDLPWSVAEQIYAMYSELYGTSQSMERISERGGFCYEEVSFLTKELKRKGKSVGTDN